MATSKGKADQFIKKVTAEAHKVQQELQIDHADIDLRIGVAIETRVTYDHHEDEA